MEKISCSNILQKLGTFEDRQNFVGFILPYEKGFDVKYFLSFLRGEKKVRINLIFS